MGDKEMVSGDGWISDDSSFYGTYSSWLALGPFTLHYRSESIDVRKTNVTMMC